MGTQQSNTVANIYDFTRMLGDLAGRAWGNDWGELKPHYASNESPGDISLPLITYQVMDRVPTPERGEIKPVLRKQAIDPNTGQNVRLYGQWFDYYIQFNVWDRSVQDCIDLMQRLEELVVTYSGYFKEKGVSEILFHRQLRDDMISKWHESLNVRSLQYKVRIEALYVIASGALKGVTIDTSIKQENHLKGGKTIG